MITDEFGGIALDEQTDEFGGVAVSVNNDVSSPQIITDPQDVNLSDNDKINPAAKNTDFFLGRVNLKDVGWNQQHESLLREINQNPTQEAAKLRNIGWLSSELNVSPDKIFPVYDQIIKQVWPDENLMHEEVENRIMAEQKMTADRYTNFLMRKPEEIKAEFEDDRVYEIYPTKGGMLRNIINSPAGQIGKHFTKGVLNIGYNVERVFDRVADFTTGGFAGRSIYSEYLDAMGLDEAHKTLRRWQESPQLMTDEINEAPFTRLFGMAAESIPYSAAMALAYASGGTTLALGLGTAVEAGGVYDEMMINNPDIDPKKAAFVSLVTGVISAEIEQRIAARNVKFAKGGSVAAIRTFAKTIAEKAYDKTANMAGKFTADIVTNSVVNALEEGGQYLTTEIIPNVAVDDWPKNPDGTIAWSKMSGELKDAMMAGFITSAIIEAGGRGIVSGSNISVSEKYHKIVDTAFKNAKVVENEPATIKIPPIPVEPIASPEKSATIPAMAEKQAARNIEPQNTFAEEIQTFKHNAGLQKEAKENALAVTTKGSNVFVQVPDSSFSEIKKGIFGKIVTPAEFPTSGKVLVEHELDGQTVQRWYNLPLDVHSAKLKTQIPEFPANQPAPEDGEQSTPPIIPATEAEQSPVNLTPSRLAQRTEELAIEKKLTKEFSDLAGYETMNMAEQSQLAKAEMDKDYEQAKKMARGEINPPAGLRPASIHEAVKFRATIEGDVETLRGLALPSETSIATRLSELGQEIKAADVRNPEDPVRVMQDIITTAEKSFESRTGKKVKTVKKENVKEIKKSIAKESKTKIIKTWEEFIVSIQC